MLPSYALLFLKQKNKSLLKIYKLSLKYKKKSILFII